jgi:hypothetical protein
LALAGYPTILPDAQRGGCVQPSKGAPRRRDTSSRAHCMEVPLTLSWRTIALRRVEPVGKWRKKRSHLIAAIANVLLLSSLCIASAADPYDGQWNGAATATQGSRCQPGSVTVTVLGQEVIGEAKFGVDARNINGTVRPDGTFGGTIGFQHLVGKFNEETFEGAFQGFNCGWTLILKRSRPRAPASGAAFRRHARHS